MFIVEKRNNLLVKCSDRSPVGTTPTKSPTPQPTFEPTVSALQNFSVVVIQSLTPCSNILRQTSPSYFPTMGPSVTPRPTVSQLRLCARSCFL